MRKNVDRERVRPDIIGLDRDRARQVDTSRNDPPLHAALEIAQLRGYGI